jgi:NAD(P)-dependent dehydrogenase (short-subunit alcohol dehydrogenase family)
MDAMFDLSGRVALVTGAGQNAGAGIAGVLANRSAVVAVNDIDAERAEATASSIDSHGGRAIAVAFDVTDRAAVAAGVAKVSGSLGPIDILVNNAGVPPQMAIQSFRETDPSEWAPYIDLNLYGVLHCCHAVIDGMCERGWGRVITISSGAGQVGVPLGIATYGAGKGGALSFMRHLALEVARTGVTANSLALGMMSNAAGAEATQALARSVPVGRLGTGEDVGAAVAFLASNEASWITGQTLGVNGGSITS